MKWERLPLLLGGSLLAAIGLAWLLNLALETGWYYLPFTPLIAALVLSGVLVFLIQWSHCRKPIFAAFLGLVMSLIAFLGVYHFGLINALPPGNAHRIDLLPEYIKLRMQFDQQDEIGKPDKEAANPAGNQMPLRPKNPADEGHNWFLFFWSLVFYVGFSLFFAWARARRAYCPELKQWMIREKIPLQKGVSRTARPLFEQQDIAGFIKVINSSRAVEPNRASYCAVEYAPTDDESPLAYPTYLSLIDPHWGLGTLRILTGMSSRFHQIRLEPQESLAFQPLFPNFADKLAEAHSELRNAPEEDLETIKSTELPFSQHSGEIATIAAVSEPFRGKVFTRGRSIVGGFLVLFPLILAVAGLFVGGWGISMLSQGANPIVAISMLAMAPVLAIGGVLVFYRGAYLFECWYWSRLLFSALRQRPDPYVDPNDPDAFLVGITLRERWMRTQLETDSDLGLMKLAPKKSLILLEADFNRYSIPVGALLGATPECFRNPMDNNSEFWYVRLIVRTEEGKEEILVCHRLAEFRPRANEIRQFLAVDLCRRIRAFTET
ncbi:hypothetical protein [Symmachiella macrocystis]|nr:hypothetical protein [Symmachiella macrocystis]